MFAFHPNFYAETVFDYFNPANYRTTTQSCRRSLVPLSLSLSYYTRPHCELDSHLNLCGNRQQFYHNEFSKQCLHHLEQLDRRRSYPDEINRMNLSLTNQVPFEQQTIQRKKFQTRETINMSRLHAAAVVIQRAFRRHRLERREQAAQVIQRQYRRFSSFMNIRSTIWPSLKKIQELRSRCNYLYDEYVTKRGIFVAPLSLDSQRNSFINSANKNFLEYEDQLLKLMLKADEIGSAGNELIRDHRKALITRIQLMLDEADYYRNEQFGVIELVLSIA